MFLKVTKSFTALNPCKQRLKFSNVDVDAYCRRVSSEKYRKSKSIKNLWGFSQVARAVSSGKIQKFQGVTNLRAFRMKDCRTDRFFAIAGCL